MLFGNIIVLILHRYINFGYGTVVDATSACPVNLFGDLKSDLR
jgi:hypothetical protein